MTTALEYQDMILESSEGDWLVAVDPIRGYSSPGYEPVEYQAGTRFRVRWASKLMDEVTCYDVEGQLVEFRRPCANEFAAAGKVMVGREKHMSCIDSNTLHICAEVLLKRAGDAEKEKHLALAAQLKQGVSFLSHMAGQTDTVTVPRKLLLRTLDDAESAAEGMIDFARILRHVKAVMVMKNALTRIAELRKAAGMEEKP